MSWSEEKKKKPARAREVSTVTVVTCKKRDCSLSRTKDCLPEGAKSYIQYIWCYCSDRVTWSKAQAKSHEFRLLPRSRAVGNVTHAHTPIERFALKAHGFLFKDGNTLNVLTIERSLTPHNRWCCHRINRRKVSRWVNIVILSSEGLLNVVYCGVNWTGRKNRKKKKNSPMNNL